MIDRARVKCARRAKARYVLILIAEGNETERGKRFKLIWHVGSISRTYNTLK